MNKILLWLQRNVRLSLASLILTMLTAWFAYDQYLVIHGGSVVQVLYNTEQTINNRLFQICKTQDTIKTYTPQIIPRIRNNSKYTINHLKIRHTIITPHSTDIPYQFDINPKFTFNGQKHEAQNNSIKTEFYYKEDAFYPTDETPDLFKQLVLFPGKDDGLFQWFDIETTVTWDASNPIYFKTRIAFITVPDDSIETYEKDSLRRFAYDENLNMWVKKVYSHLKGKIQNECDLLLYFHYMGDSVSSKGTYTQLHSISNNNIDSLYTDYFKNKEFIENHHYRITNTPVQITVSLGRWFSFVLICSVIFIMLGIAISVNISNNVTDSPNYLLFSFSSCLTAAIFAFILNIIYAYNLIAVALIDFFGIIGLTISFLSIISMFFYWKKSYKQHYSNKEWLDLAWPFLYIIFVVALSYASFIEHSLL